MCEIVGVFFFLPLNCDFFCVSSRLCDRRAQIFLLDLFLLRLIFKRKTKCSMDFREDLVYSRFNNC